MSIKRITLDSIRELLETGTTVLVPNNRIRDAVLHAYADTGSTSVFATPRVLGIDVWARDTWLQAASMGVAPYCDKLTVSAAEELFLWTSLIEKSQDRYPLLNEAETASAVSRAYQLLKQWQLQEAHGETLEAYRSIPDIAAFLSWAEQFQQACEEKQLISLVDCIAQISHHLEHDDPSALPIDKKFLLLNFYQPPPLYARLFNQLAQHCQVTDIQLASEETRISGTHHQFPTQRAEFFHVANWAKTIMQQDKDAHIGLIGELGDVQRSELERILATVLDRNHIIDFSAPQALFNSTHSTHSLIDEGMVNDAFLLFDTLLPEQSGENFCRLLRSSYVLPESNEWENRFALERVLRQRVNERCQLQDILYYAGREEKPSHCPKLNAVFSELRERFRRLPKLNDPQQWSQTFLQILEHFQWPGTLLSPHQSKVLADFRKALDTLATLTPVLGTIDQGKAINCLRRLCIDTRHNQQFDHQRQISLYTIEEASGLDFDHIWLLNFNDQVWPPSISPSPFLPYSLQKEAGIPGSHSDVQFQFASEAFRILCQSVSGSVQSSHHRSDGELEYRASNFSSSFVCQQSSADTNPTPHCFYGEPYAASPQVTTVADEQTVALLPDGQSLGGHNVLSDQSSCPFRAFAHYRLQARELDQFASGLSAMARGSAVHEALEYLFKRVVDSQDLQEKSAAELEQICSAASDAAIGYLRKYHRSIMTPRFEQIEHNRILSLLQGFLAKEQERPPFTAIAWEQEHHWQYRDMLFRLKVDRIDRLADDSLAVIDYKTGKTSASLGSWLKDRPEDLQLPFYATLMRETSEQPVHAVAIAHVNAENTQYSGIMESDQFHRSVTDISAKQPDDKDWDKLMQHFQSVLHRTADQFHEGVATVNPVNPPSTCRYCDLHALCRIQEQVDLSEDVDVNGEHP